MKRENERRILSILLSITMICSIFTNVGGLTVQAEANKFKLGGQYSDKDYLPDIRRHDLRSTFCTILLKDSFSPKAVSKLMDHAKELISEEDYLI